MRYLMIYQLEIGTKEKKKQTQRNTLRMKIDDYIFLIWKEIIYFESYCINLK